MHIDNINNLFEKYSVVQNAIIYCRSSTKEQNNFNHCSLDTQTFNCRNYCNQNNLNIINMSTEICRATSTINQKELLQIIDKFKNINLIIYDASRFSRNILEGIILLNKCKEKNIIIHNVKDNYSTEKHQGYCNFIDGIKNGETESRLISDRIKSSIKYRKSLGANFGRPPFGFKSERFNGIVKFVKDEIEIEIINFARNLYYGCTLIEANKQMMKITGNNIQTLFTEKCKKIEYGNFTFTMIAEFFNEHGIKNRTHVWTGSSISMIVNTDPVVGKRKGYNDYNSDNDNTLLEIKNKKQKYKAVLDKDV
jgi:DNA invertase Pin-like site-specific DNA recombinase